MVEYSLIERLRLAREIRQLTLPELSRQTGYAVSTLSNVEQGRDKPSAQLIQEVAQWLEVDPVWLHSGTGPMFQQNSKLAKLYLEVWVSNSKRHAEVLKIKGREQIDEAKRLEEKIVMIEEALRLVGEGTHALKLRLTDVMPEYKHQEMQARLEKLIERLKSLTQPRGMKTQLASFMGVPLPRVSEWLAGRKSPNGETALRLLDWAEQQEAKQKGPGSADTPPEPKAQPESKSHEKQNRSGPRKH